MAPTTLAQIDGKVHESKSNDFKLTARLEQLKLIVQNLYNLIVQSLDHQGTLTEDAMKREMYVALSGCIHLCYLDYISD